MRDLEKEIAEWRRTMAKASPQRESLDELEEHLRDEIERLVRVGKSKEEAFQLAAAKLGSPSAVAGEFEKLAVSRRGKWKPATIAQVLCMIAAMGLAVLAIKRMGDGPMGVLLAGHILTVGLGYITMFIVGGLGICYVLANWFGHAGARERFALQRASFYFAGFALALTIVGVVMGMFWAKANLGRYWGWDPKEIGAVVVLGCGTIMVVVGGLRSANANLIASMSIVGNISTAWAWFGTTSGAFQSGPLLLAFIGSQCAVLAAIPAMRFRDGARAG